MKHLEIEDVLDAIINERTRIMQNWDEEMDLVPGLNCAEVIIRRLMREAEE